MKRTPILMNKLVYLGLSTFEISNIVMHEFWYDYENMKKKQNYVPWIDQALLYT